jgi:hypothetical protein
VTASHITQHNNSPCPPPAWAILQKDANEMEMRDEMRGEPREEIGLISKQRCWIVHQLRRPTQHLESQCVSHIKRLRALTFLKVLQEQITFFVLRHGGDNDWQDKTQEATQKIL